MILYCTNCGNGRPEVCADCMRRLSEQEQATFAEHNAASEREQRLQQTIADALDDLERRDEVSARDRLRAALSETGEAGPGRGAEPGSYANPLPAEDTGPECGGVANGRPCYFLRSGDLCVNHAPTPAPTGPERGEE